MPSHGFYNWPRVCPRPWAQRWRKMHWKNKAFPFGGGPNMLPFFRCGLQGTVGKNWGNSQVFKVLTASLFDAIKIRGFFDLNRWWIQEETAPRFYTFGHLRQHPALGALYRVFWPKWSFTHPTKALRLEVGCLGGWMSNKMGVAIAKLCTLLGAEFNALQYINIHRVSKSFFIGLHLSLLCRRFRRVRF